MLPRVDKNYMKKQIHENFPKWDFKFSNARHPFLRLVSAYHSKFSYSNVNTTENYFLRKQYPIIYKFYESKEYKRNNNYYKINGQKMWVSWPAFIKFIVYRQCKNSISLIKTCDSHYLPYSYSCQPCIQKYNAISKSENLDFEAKAIIERLLPENVNIFDRIADKIMDPSYSHTKKRKNVAFVKENYYDILDENLKKKLVRLYYWDFRLYNYGFEEFL